jgi:hypothetical protein
MLKLESPFHLTESAHELHSRSGLGQRPPKASEIILDGLSILIEAGRKTYDVVSEGPPEHDSAGAFRGTTWARWLLPVTGEMSIEQQMVLPAGGDALAISWRSIGQMFVPCRLKVRPVFRANPAFSQAGFDFEPETDGGRLAWQPLGHSSKIIADTNGRFRISRPSLDADFIPALFEFDLGPNPALLILTVEPRSEAGIDPLIGGFLADLLAQRAAAIDYNRGRDLVAA